MINDISNKKKKKRKSTNNQTQAEKEVQVIKPLPKSSNFS